MRFFCKVCKMDLSGFDFEASTAVSEVKPGNGTQLAAKPNRSLPTSGKQTRPKCLKEGTGSQAIYLIDFGQLVNCIALHENVHTRFACKLGHPVGHEAMHHKHTVCNCSPGSAEQDFLIEELILTQLPEDFGCIYHILNHQSAGFNLIGNLDVRTEVLKALRFGDIYKAVGTLFQYIRWTERPTPVTLRELIIRLIDKHQINYPLPI